MNEPLKLTSVSDLDAEVAKLKARIKYLNGVRRAIAKGEQDETPPGTQAPDILGEDPSDLSSMEVTEA